MYKIAILGCENSHANNFLSQIIEQKRYPDIEVVGVYSNEPAAAEKLYEKFGVAVASEPDAFVGKIDGLVITARDGANHYPYAKPYIESGVPMFIDKPITCDDDEAIDFMKALKAGGVRVTGGSSCIHSDDVRSVKEALLTDTEGGPILAGHLRAPLLSSSPYGGVFFYAQHLVQIMQEVFGYYPETVYATKKAETVTVIFGYPEYDVVGLFADRNFSLYTLTVQREKTAIHTSLTVDQTCFDREFAEFYELMKGGAQKQSYRDFIAPVFVMTALVRSLASGKTETVCRSEEI